MESRLCALPECGKSFTPRRSTQKFHSPQCAKIAANRRSGSGVAPIPSTDTASAIAQLESQGFIVHKPQPPLPVREVDTRRLKGDRFRVGILSDTHIGSKFQQLTFLKEHAQYMKRQKVSAILHAGDITDGSPSMHPGFVYETFLHGADAQIEYAVEHLPKIGVPWYVIGGNHDASHYKAAGIDVAKAICAARDDMAYLESSSGAGRDSIGYVRLNGTLIQLCHPHLGATRTRSYRVERWVEELSPETKPNVVVMGNFHKVLLLDYRNVFSLMVPAYQAQSAWMASKGISSYIGGAVLEFGSDSKGLAPAISVEWLIERVPRENDW